MGTELEFPPEAWTGAAQAVLGETDFTARVLCSESWDFSGGGPTTGVTAQEHSRRFHIMVFLPDGVTVNGQGSTLEDAVESARDRLKSALEDQE